MRKSGDLLKRALPSVPELGLKVIFVCRKTAAAVIGTAAVFVYSYPVLRCTPKAMYRLFPKKMPFLWIFLLMPVDKPASEGKK